MSKLTRILRFCLVVVFVGFGCGCTPVHGNSLADENWFFGFFAPKYLDVWIETANVTDIDGRFYPGAMSGLAASQRAADDIGAPTHWPDKFVWGKGKEVDGANLPESVYVRWQSLAEPQTYEARIHIPEATRALMSEKKQVYCEVDKKWEMDSKRALILGLAPGGVVKVWVSSVCSGSTEVVRVKGSIVPFGPFAGGAGAKYVELPSKSRSYIDKYGVPEGSW